jgi:hypothetical protein
MDERTRFLILSGTGESDANLIVGLLDIMVSCGIQKDPNLIEVLEGRFRFRGKWIRCSIKKRSLNYREAPGQLF